MRKKKTQNNSSKSWIILTLVVGLGSAAIGSIYDLMSNAFIAESWHDFLKLTMISAGSGVFLFVLYLIYSFITERIHKKHPNWFAPQDPPSKNKSTH